MKVNISEISKINGASLNIEFNETLPDLGCVEDGYIFDKPIGFKGQIENVNGVLILDGHLKVDYIAKCYRCLRDVDRKIDIGIRDEFISSKKATDNDFYIYSGNFVELDRVLKDNIILNLPMRQVCTKECKGLCSKCGINLNEKKCDCMEDLINPQMEALKSFFNN